MATYTGTTINDIIIGNNVEKLRVENGSHTFIVGGLNLSVRVKNFYGDQVFNVTPDASQPTPLLTPFFDDITGAIDSVMCIRIFHGNLTINQNITFTPPYRTRGMYVFVKGNLTNNGSMSMTARGAAGSGVNLPIWTNATLPSLGGTGGTSVGATTGTSQGFNGISGTSGTGRATGGGASGSARKNGTQTNTVSSGIGTQGHTFSGGNGGGGENGWNATPTDSPDATLSAGGNGIIRINTTGYTAGLTVTVGGGAGVVGGVGRTFFSNSTTVNTSGSPSTANSGANGSGGLLLLSVLGNYKKGVQLNGFASRGSNGGNGSQAGGGGSGGGSINVIAKSFLDSNNNVIASSTIQSEAQLEVVGGTGGTGGVNATAGNGGAGTATIKTLTEEGISSLPKRVLIKSQDSKLWYRDFQSNVWLEATGSGTVPFEQYGMFETEVYMLTRENLASITNISETQVRFEVYTP